MAKGLQLLLAGVLLGLMGVFAVIGVQSVLKDRADSQSTTQQPELVQQQGQQSSSITPQADTSMTMADQAAQQPADTTQLTPSQSSEQGQQNTQQAAQQQQPADNSASNNSDPNDAANTAQQSAETAQQQAAAQPTQSLRRIATVERRQSNFGPALSRRS